MLPSLPDLTACSEFYFEIKLAVTWLRNTLQFRSQTHHTGYVTTRDTELFNFKSLYSLPQIGVRTVRESDTIKVSLKNGKANRMKKPHLKLNAAAFEKFVSVLITKITEH